MGHAITINSMLRLKKMEVKGVEAYSCSGTPADCVKIGTVKVLNEKPDLIISGINHGSNSSINVIYSGTMSAAVEGSIEGIPAIGFSLCNTSIDADFSPFLNYAESIIKYVLENKMKKHTCLNVNFPSISADLIQGIKVCRQADAVWEEEFDERKDPSGELYYWLTGRFVNREPDSTDTDEWALSQNYISIVPVSFDVTNYESIKLLKNIENVKG
jgi:5'-nucleotidase